MKDNIPQCVAICGVEPVVKKTRLQIIIDWVVTIGFAISTIIIVGYLLYLVVT